jgi:hypothetical protein
MKLLIHIGLNRTGTSSLQKFLRLNSKALRAFGIYFPEKIKGTDKHHVIAGMSSKELQKLATSLKRAMARDETLVLSSEAFAAAGSSRFAPLFDQFDVTTSVYLREHLEYIKSWWAFDVGVQTKTTSLEDFAWFNRHLRFEQMLQGWPNLNAAVYKKEALVGSSLSGDFLARFFPDALSLIDQDWSGDRVNRSIGGNLLFIKFLANIAIPDRDIGVTGSEMFRLASAFSSFSEPPSMETKFESSMWKGFAEDREFAERLGLRLDRRLPASNSSFPRKETLREDFDAMVGFALENQMVLYRYFLAISEVVKIRADSTLS